MLHGLVSFYDEPIENITRCLVGLQLAGVGHVTALDGAYRLFPNGRASSPSNQHAAWIMGARELDMGCTLHVPAAVWDGNEAQKRTALFAHALAAVRPGDWFVVIDGDEFITAVPDDLDDRLRATELDVGEIQALDVVAQRIQRRDMPERFSVRKLFRAQPITVGPAHCMYRAADGRLLWGETGAQQSEPTFEVLDMLVEHHPDRRPMDRLSAKLAYYRARDEALIERGDCHWCGEPAVTLVGINWRMNATLNCPVGEWREACINHVAVAERISRTEFELLGIDPDSVQVENRMGRAPAAR